MKTCSKCNISKDNLCFSKRAKAKDGLKQWCKDCDRFYAQNLDKETLNKRKRLTQKERKNRLRLKMLEFLANKKCAHCPETDPVVMEFDHLDSNSKRICVSEAVAHCFSWENVKAEIDKCQILCANCHRRKTAKEFDYYRTGSGATS